LVELIGGTSGRVCFTAMMPRHLVMISRHFFVVVIRPCVTIARRRCRTLRGHRRRCHRRRRRRWRRSRGRARTRAVRRQSRSAGVRTRGAHGVATGRTSLRPNGRRKRKRGGHRHTGQKMMFHVCDPFSDCRFTRSPSDVTEFRKGFNEGRMRERGGCCAPFANRKTSRSICPCPSCGTPGRPARRRDGARRRCRGGREVTRLQPLQLFLVQLVGGTAGHLLTFPAMMPGHLAVRGMSGMTVLRRRRRTGIRHRRRRRRRGSHCRGRCRARPR
jgi:hypothetical protein